VSATDAATAGAARVRVSLTSVRVGGEPMAVAHVFLGKTGLPTGLALSRLDRMRCSNGGTGGSPVGHE
jgi:hypothetical protein